MWPGCNSRGTRDPTQTCLFPSQLEFQRNWFNLSAQELQPFYYTEHLEGEGWVRTRGCPEDAWSGGSSLMIEGKISAGLSKICARWE